MQYPDRHHMAAKGVNMDLRDLKLSDRYDLKRSPVLLSGTQALVRATLMQRARDQRAGKDTAGYVTGYRGSPLGAVDGTFLGAKKFLEPAQIIFHPGLNEDLAATALWGTQMAELKGEGKYDGVFGMWYGKGPGVDRCGDVFRHANIAGSSPTSCGDSMRPSPKLAKRMPRLWR